MMTVDDMQRVLSLPGDPEHPEFGPAVMEAGARLAMAAADDRGLRAALHEAVQLVLVGMSIETDRPRATLHMLIAELTEGAEELLALTGHARHDA
ncbi:hypothetical protein [Paracoccus sanguinis]|uniref:Uncharacterized protein n=1 Tax=Paracoccus sanguinis TaxID=1545044 RepID=A0A099G954_9RHOB|nr:hypothetical protein [Paracoccus sanguinis]KGJ18703.1 hypothetical protein IX57_02980 [Paracoccus sanguinis]KGJ21035.1 hypothetical protein IX55_03695 [Paracoccus sanguinis]KGJ23258.1 hypothetical protein IX56_03080 [Paracoccus sanguinis]SDX43895.1 hypothetical protein SAMN05444276_106112 [Paracoccus sanguinis]